MPKLGLDRRILAQFLPNPEAIAAFEKVFAAVGATLPDTIEEANALAAQALAAAAQALSMLAVLADTLDRLAVAPAPQPPAEADDHTPRVQLGSISAQNHDAVDVTGGTVGLDAGTLAAPSFYMQERATGFYRISANRWGFSINNALLLDFSSVLVGLSGRLQLDVSNIGTEASPSLYFGTETGTGFYRIGANHWGLSIAGAKLADFAATGAAFAQNVSTSKQLVSSIAAGTPPLVVASTTKVVNLYVDRAAEADHAAEATHAANADNATNAANAVNAVNATNATDAVHATSADNLGAPGAYPADATDLATAIALVNYIKSRNTSKGV